MRNIIEYRKNLENKSLSSLLTILRFKLDNRKILKSVNYKEFNRIYEKYKDTSPNPGYSKYLDIKYWMPRNLWHAYIMGLNKPPEKNILDIGTGNAYFAYISKYFGHNVKTIDKGDTAMNNELVRMFDVDRKDIEIKAFHPLPRFDMKFNLITGFMVCFNNHYEPDVWGINEWDYFLKDIADNHLEENGEVFFTLNPEPDGKYYNDSLYDFFIGNGAVIDEERIYFASLDKFRNKK